MRAITTAETTIMAAPGGYASQVAVWVKDSGGTWRLLNSLFGINWVLSAEWGESIDQDCGNASISLRRDVYDYSAAPQMSASALNALAAQPLCRAGAEVSICVKVVPLG
jgi:hypothetical protein